jgi:hypothetical protein
MQLVTTSIPEANGENDVEAEPRTPTDAIDDLERNHINPATWEAAEREEHVQRAVAGDAEAAAFVLRYRQSIPEADERFGNPAHQALESIVGLTAGNDRARAQALRDECAKYRRELLSPTPQRLERMAVDTVLVSWAYVHYLYQGSPGRAPTPPVTLLKAQREAQRCYEGALRSLELVRNKLMPANRQSAQQASKAVSASKPDADDVSAKSETVPQRPRKLKIKLPRK